MTLSGSAGRRDVSPFGSVDGSVNQAVDLEVAGTFNAGQSGSAGLDQVQSSRPGGRRTVLSLSDTMTGRGAQRYIPAQASAKPPYIGVPQSLGQPSTGMSQLLANRQSGSIGANSNTRSSKAVGFMLSSGIEAARPSAARNRAYVPGGYKRLRQMGNMGNKDLPVTLESAQNSLELLKDPFLAPSTASWEGFKQRSDFEQACGDACSLGKTASGEPSTGGSRGRRRAGDLPESEMPATKGVYGQEPSRLGEPGSLTTKPN